MNAEDDKALSRHLEETPEITIHVFEGTDPMVVVRWADHSGIRASWLTPRGPVMQLVHGVVGRKAVLALTRDPRSMLFRLPREDDKRGAR